MIILSCDHGGYDLLQSVAKFLKKQHIEYKWMGPTELNTDDDYPDYIIPACKEILKAEDNWGIFACGSGIGVNMVANRHKGIRAVCANDVETAFLSRRHNNANVLTMGGRIVSSRSAIKIVKMFLSTEYEGGRHDRRLAKFN